MEGFINGLIDFFGQFGLFSGMFLVFLESIIPILPLSVFVALNIFTYGSTIGYIISYIGTILGSFFAYFISMKFSDFFEKRYKRNKKVRDFKKKIRTINLPSLVLIISIPFTPAFAINIAAGLTKFDFKKYLLALIIGKLPMIYFWAFIGASLKESLTDITILIKIVVMIILTYLVSKVVNKLINE